MANLIRLFDTVNFKPVDKPTKDNFIQTQNGGQALIITIAASHAGIITRNNGMYLPDRMRKGVPTFVENYQKPIQVHHNDTVDPIGRVIKAEYIDTSASAREKFINFVSRNNKYNDAFINDFMTGKLPFIRSFNFIADELARRDSVLDDANYQGLGYAQLTAKITDPDAIQKVLDGRYLTGSVGVTTNRAVCSVCKQDWTGDDGRCEHRPGKEYDDKKCFLVTGDLTYDEYSMVNCPADPHSRILQILNNGAITDSFNMNDDSVGRERTVEIITIADNMGTEPSAEQKGKIIMDAERLKTLLATMKAKFTGIIDEATLGTLLVPESIEVNMKAYVDAKKCDTLFADEAEEEWFIKHEEHLDKEAITAIFAMDATKKLDAMKQIRPEMEVTALEACLKDTHATAEDFCKAINDIEWNDYSDVEDEAVEQLATEILKDSKLSGAQRKRLPGSSFCGPNRSFPVTDAALVAVTRKLVNKASVSSATKVRILLNVDRKAKVFAAVVNDEKKPEETKTENQTAEQQEVSNTTCQTCEDLKKQLADITSQKDEAVKTKDELVKSVEELTKQLDSQKEVLAEAKAIKDELKIVSDDLTVIQDELINARDKVQTLEADKVILYRQLSGEVIEDLTKAKDELVASGAESIKDAFTKVSTKVDIKKIADSINSGLTRDSVESVNDPTISLENHKDKKEYNLDTLKTIRDKYIEIQLGGNSPYGRGPQAAERFLNDMRKQGLVPTEEEFAKLITA